MGKLFIPVPFGSAGEGSSLVDEKSRNELEGGVDPFLAPSGEKKGGQATENVSEGKKGQEDGKSGSALVRAEDRKEGQGEPLEEAKQAENRADARGGKASLGGSGSAQKTELDEILQENILEAEEPSKLGLSSGGPAREPGIKPGDSFWTEVNVNGKRQSILVRVKQVTIVQKVASSEMKSTTAARELRPTASKAAAEQFPFIKIQLPGIFKSATASASSMSSTKDIGRLFSSLFRTDPSTATPLRGAASQAATSMLKSEKPTAAVSARAEKGRGAAGGSSSKPDTISKTSSSDEKPFKNIASIMGSASRTAHKGAAEAKQAVSTRVEAQQKRASERPTKAAVPRAGGAASSSAPGARASTPGKRESTRLPQASSRYGERERGMPAQATAKGEPTSLGDIFDVLKNMPGASGGSTTRNTFIEGQFTFPKEKEMSKRVFKLSGYISNA